MLNELNLLSEELTHGIGTDRITLFHVPSGSLFILHPVPAAPQDLQFGDFGPPTPLRKHTYHRKSQFLNWWHSKGAFRDSQLACVEFSDFSDDTTAESGLKT